MKIWLPSLRAVFGWFFPLKQYPFKKGHLKFESGQLGRELLLLGLVLLLRRLSQSR